MRILHLFASPVFSGPAENIALLAKEQRALGHQVSVAIDLLRGQTTSEELAATRFRELGLLDESGLELSVKSGLLASLRDGRVLRGLTADVVHSHFSHDHWLARLWKPKTATLIRSIHAPRSARMVPFANGFTAPYDALLETLPQKPKTTFHAMVDDAFHPAADKAQLRKRLGIEASKLIGMVSTFQPNRQHSVAIDAFARLRESDPGARLALVGDGITEPQLRAQVERLKLSDSVSFVGYKNGPAFVEWLQSMDEVWILGLGNDFSARAAVQARACGARVVGANVGALCDLADETLTEISPSALARASGGQAKKPLVLPSNREIAQNVLKLYAQAAAS